MNYDLKRWLFLLACMLINISAGFCYAWSVFQKPLLSLFNWTAVEVSLGFTLIMSVSALPMALAGKAQDHIEPRQVILLGGVLLGLGVIGTGYVNSLWQLYLTYGIIGGLGVGIIYAGTVANMLRFFPDRRGLASGLLSAGFGSGAVILAPFSAFLIEKYGVMAAFKILGLLFLVMVGVLSRLVKTAPPGYKPVGWQPPAQGSQNTEVVDKDWRQMLQDPLFYLIFAIFVLGTTSGLMIMGHASSIAQEILKISPQAAAVIVGFLALANTTGRAFWGWVSDRVGRYPIIMLLYILAGTAMLALSKVDTYYVFVLLLLGIGLCYGGFMGMMASLTADTFGVKHLGVNFGIMFLSVSVAAYAGPRLAAVVKETNNGDYSLAFVIAALLSLIGLMIAILAFYKKSQAIK